METFLIETTRQQGLQPIGSAGDRSHARLVQILESRLSAEHAGLFAEPVSAPDGSSTDWYVPFEGRVESLSYLDEDRRAAVEAEIARLRDDITGLADSLERKGTPSELTDAKALRAALEVPGPEYIRVVGGRPVLVCWAHRDAKPGAPQGVLYRLVRAPVPPSVPDGPPPPPPPPVRGPFPWMSLLLWLLLALIIAILMRLSLNACGLAPEGGAYSWCPAVHEDGRAEFEEARDQGRALQNQIDAAEREISRRRAACQVEPPAPAAETPQAPPAPPSDADRRVEQSGGEQGDLQFTLIWDGPADLDMHLTCPDGRINYGQRSGCGGGALDIDANVGRTMPQPVENIRWSGDAPPGTYSLEIDHYNSRGETRPEVPFTVQIRRNGQVETHEGVIRPGERLRITEFDLP